MEKLLKIFPILSGLLLFFSFFYLHSYYKNFGINIYSFVSTGEIILGFLPFIIDVVGVLSIGLIILTFFLLMSVPAIVYDRYSLSPIDGYEEKSTSQIIHEILLKRSDKKNWNKLKFKEKFSDIFFLIINKITILHALILFIIYYLFKDFLNPQILWYKPTTFIDPHVKFYEMSFSIKFSYFILFIVVVYWIKKVILPYSKFKKYSMKILAVFSLFFLMGFINIQGKVIAERILDGKLEYNVMFSYADTLYKSDSNFVYVGTTQNYLFLRDRMSNQNFIFNLSEVKNLSLVKLKK